jgi:hypothetical protein
MSTSQQGSIAAMLSAEWLQVVGRNLTDPEKCFICVHGSLVYSPYVQLQFLERLLVTEMCNLLPDLTYFDFRNPHPDDATMADVKKALSDDGIDINQLKEWNAYF